MATVYQQGPPPYGGGMINVASPPLVQFGRPAPFSPPYGPAYPPQVVTYPPITPITYASPLPNQVVVVNSAVNPIAMCQQKGHDPITNYGTLGILSAIFCFPVGIICCLLDQRTMCRRCGSVLSAGCD